MAAIIASVDQAVLILARQGVDAASVPFPFPSTRLIPSETLMRRAARKGRFESKDRDAIGRIARPLFPRRLFEPPGFFGHNTLCPDNPKEF
jgi:hypothetical protein